MKKIAYILAFILCISYNVNAQYNVDFENGYFTKWQGAYNDTTCGTSTPNPLTIMGIDSLSSPSSQQIILSTGYDPSISSYSLPVNSPFGGNYSVRLGDIIDGCGSANLTYTFVIYPPTGYITISYATIFKDDGTLGSADAPKFIYGMTVCGGGYVISSDTIMYSASDTSFHHANNTSDLYYSRWKSLCINLLPYLGVCNVVELSVTSSDGNTGLHRGYAYVDFQWSTCGLTTAISINKNLSDKIFIYPNPAINTIQLTSLNNEFTEVVITDILGNELRRATMQQGKTTLDISNLQQGVYFLKNNQGTQKFIKQ